MELWIRSQDRASIVKINKQVGLKYNDNKTIIADYIPDFSDKYDGSYDILGTYESKERALEILDEITKKLDNADDNGITTYVYKMPKE